MDEVPCLHLSAWRLLDAREHKFVAEYIIASPCVFSFNVAFFLFSVSIKSIIQNNLDFGVVFTRHITPGVKIDGMRVFQVQNDEGAGARYWLRRKTVQKRPSSSN